VFTSALFWRVAPLTVISQVAFMSVYGLWSGPWLRDMAGMDRAGIAGVLFWSAAAMTAGFVIAGFFTERLNRAGIRRWRPLWGDVPVHDCANAARGGAGELGHGPLGPFRFHGNERRIPYPALAMSFPAQLAGRVSTGLNVLVFVAAFAAQWGIGAVIALFSVTTSGGYSPTATTPASPFSWPFKPCASPGTFFLAFFAGDPESNPAAKRGGG